MKQKTIGLIILALVAIVSVVIYFVYDPHRKDECEWYISPSLKHMPLAKEGHVALCAQNFVTRKQRCFIQAPLEMAEKIYGIPFRFSDIVLEKGKMPRRILELKGCKPKEGLPSPQ